MMHDITPRENNKHIARQRSQIYQWLGELFLGADSSKIVAAVRRAPLRDRLGRLTGNSASEHLFKSHLCGSRPSTLVERIAEEHRELFGASSKRSSFLSEHAFLRRSQIDVERANTLPDLYTRFGFEYRRHGKQTDHLGIEMLFMSHLCALERRAWHQQLQDVARQNTRHQMRFLQEHLMPWTAWLREAIDQSDKACWFRVIAAAAQAFITTDYERLQTVPQPSVNTSQHA